MNIELVVNTFFTSVGAYITVWAIVTYVKVKIERMMREL
jgi:hypothetical protein